MCGEDNHNNDYLTNALHNNDCDQKSSNFYRAFEYTPAVCGLCLRNMPFECKNLQPDPERCVVGVHGWFFEYSRRLSKKFCAPEAFASFF